MAEWDLDLIAQWMLTHDGEGYVDPDAGEVYGGGYGEVFDRDGDVLEEIPEAWVRIPHSTSHEDFAVMEDFAQLLTEPHLREQLERALEGRGPFRRFRDTVFSIDGLGHLWLDYRQARVEREAAEWLIDEEARASRSGGSPAGAGRGRSRHNRAGGETRG